MTIMAVSGKYGKIEIEGIGEDEPVFILRAKDRAAMAAVDRYAQAARTLGAAQEFLDSVNERVRVLNAWRLQHPHELKIPD
jgi:hypothetical protein